MKCQDVRLAIDTASRREPMSRATSLHLSGCPDCSRYADETSALLKLICAQPKVAAPADFDFRLRARIARAESDRRRPAAFFERPAFFEKLWDRTFSWGQVAAVTAT